MLYHRIEKNTIFAQNLTNKQHNLEAHDTVDDRFWQGYCRNR